MDSVLPRRDFPFLSYCQDDMETARTLEALLAARKVGLIWDKRHLELDGSIGEFMTLSRDWPAVILLVSDPYLKSRSCMREVLEVMEGGDPFQRIHPLILPSAHIFSPEGRAGYVQYWAAERQRLQEEILKINQGAAAGSLICDLAVLDRICGVVDPFLAHLADRYSPTEVLQFVDHFCAGRQLPA